MTSLLDDIRERFPSVKPMDDRTLGGVLELVGSGAAITGPLFYSIVIRMLEAEARALIGPEPAPPDGAAEREDGIVREYLADYVCSLDEGDYEPTEHERALLEDFGNGLLAFLSDRRTPAPGEAPAAAGTAATAYAEWQRNRRFPNDPPNNWTGFEAGWHAALAARPAAAVTDVLTQRLAHAVDDRDSAHMDGSETRHVAARARVREVIEIAQALGFVVNDGRVEFAAGGAS